MKIRVLILMCLLAAAPARVLAQGCQQNLQRIVLTENSYTQIDPSSFRGNDRLFAYLPDINTSLFGGGWAPFQLSIIEGVYGAPLPSARGSLSGRAFQSLRTSRNVRITAVSVPYDAQTKRAARVSQPVVVGGQPVRVEVDDVRTQWIGSDTVTFRICR